MTPAQFAALLRDRLEKAITGAKNTAEGYPSGMQATVVAGYLSGYLRGIIEDAISELEAGVLVPAKKRRRRLS